MAEPWVKIGVKRYDEISRATNRVLGMPVETPQQSRRNIPTSDAIRLRVKSVSNDHLVCRTWDGTNEGTVDLNVAKPYILRCTPFHGKTLTVNGNTLTYSYSSGTQRTVTKGSSSETQIIVPGYVTTGSGYGGSEIYAERCDTGVVLNAGQSNEERLDLIDKNIDGRMWAKQ